MPAPGVLKPFCVLQGRDANRRKVIEAQATRCRSRPTRTRPDRWPYSRAHHLALPTVREAARKIGEAVKSRRRFGKSLTFRFHHSWGTSFSCLALPTASRARSPPASSAASPTTPSKPTPPPTQETPEARPSTVRGESSAYCLGLGLDPVRVAKIAGHSNVSVTLNTYAEEFDKAMHQEDLRARIAQAGFGAISRDLLTFR
jgi:hypothetical protein